MKTTTWVIALLLALLLAQADPAAAATIYRCGQTYQQVPCAGGDAVEAADARSAAQRQDARAAAAAEQRQARALAAERREREKVVVTQTAPMGIAAPRPAPGASEAEGATRAPKKKKPKAGQEPRYWSRGDAGTGPAAAAGR